MCSTPELAVAVVQLEVDQSVPDRAVLCAAGERVRRALPGRLGGGCTACAIP